jgi:hypothetical protein
LQLVVVVVRLIWLRRNRWVFEGELQPPAVLVRLARDQLEAYTKAEEGGNLKSFSTVSPAGQRWVKPPIGILKMNWDAVVDREGQQMGVRVVGRDSFGKVCVAFVKSQKFITDPTTVEAMVAWQMAEIYVRMGFFEVILEVDLMEVVQALNQEDCSWGRYGSLINEAKLLLQQVYRWKVSHVTRTANEVAHRLAKFALFLGEERLWCEEYPPCIHDIVICNY